MTTAWNDTRDDAPGQAGASYARHWLNEDQPDVLSVRRELAKLRRRVNRKVEDGTSPNVRRRKADQDMFDRSYARVLIAWLEQVHHVTEASF